MAEYPFSAVVGQPQFKTALLLAAVNPALGGVLVAGPRGCAKSTLVRALAALLPDAPFVNMPLGVSEEMLTGTLDLQQVLNEKTVSFRPGLFSKAHQGVLYVDEVNLLADPLVDLLLDVSASGVNHVERDGISQQHDARFVLIGTMNPDEGELREQLQDRFGLMVQLDNNYSLQQRVQIVRDRESFDRDPHGFCTRFATAQQALQQQIQAAQALLVQVSCDEALLLEIARRCQAAGVDGLRGDIVWYRAALAHAALAQRTVVTVEDIDAVETLVLAHRRQAEPPSPQPPSPPPFQRPPETRPPHSRHDGQRNDAQSPAPQGDWGAMTRTEHRSIGTAQAPAFSVAAVCTPAMPVWLSRGGKRQGNNQGEGRRAGCDSAATDWFASLVKTLPYWPPQQLVKRKQRSGALWLHLVLLDTSGSTLSGDWLGRAKAVVLDIGERAYLAREQLAIIGFGNQQTEPLLARVRAPKQLRTLLEPIQAGGGTPLRQVLSDACHMLQQALQRQPELNCCSYLITDGRSREQVSDIQLPGRRLLIDTEQAAVKRGRGEELARQLGAAYYAL
ncbi:MAG: ATP-binding protein [Marinobacterium sp.]|nr:ATP-binding protein [Marinobacterium sp.]